MRFDIIFSYLSNTDSIVCRLSLGLHVSTTPETILTDYINLDDVVGLRNVLELYRARWDSIALVHALYRAGSRHIIQNCEYFDIKATDVIRYVVLQDDIRMLQWIINADMIIPDQICEIFHKAPHLRRSVQYPSKFTL